MQWLQIIRVTNIREARGISARWVNQAIRKMFHAQDVVAIQGPTAPKNEIIVQLLQYLTENANRKKKPLKVLVSSVQNEAVYGVVERLVAMVISQSIMLRSSSSMRSLIQNGSTKCVDIILLVSSVSNAISIQN